MSYKAEQIFAHLPAWLKDLVVTFESTRLYYMRRTGIYKQRKQQYSQLMTKSYEELKLYQKKKLEEIFYHAKGNSSFYAKKYEHISEPVLEKMPILEKEDLRKNIDDIVIGDRKKMIELYTGGTTGKGLALYLDKSSLQDRISILDLFWEMHNYNFRDKFAWFSGRHLISNKDTDKGIFWRTNKYLNIRYYSTFHMGIKNLPYYAKNINRYKPRFFSGFPAAICEIASYMQTENIKPEFQLEAIFTTSESLHQNQRQIIESVFQCKVRDQYGAAEGPPFIMQCPEGNYHLDMASGIMEVIDEQGNSAQEGDILVTSFHMRQTPVIRYRIGDCVRMSDQIGCQCGWDTPIVAKIIGRKMDFIEIPGRGKMWCSQIGDCVKGVTTVVKFQLELVNNSRLKVYMVANKEQFEKKDRNSFLLHLHERAGDIPVDIVYVDDLPRTQGGKHTVVRKSDN